MVDSFCVLEHSSCLFLVIRKFWDVNVFAYLQFISMVFNCDGYV